MHGMSVVITNNTHVTRYNTGEKFRQTGTGRGYTRTAGKCGTDAAVGHLCVALLLRVPQKGNGVLVYELMYSYPHKRSDQLYSIHTNAVTKCTVSTQMQSPTVQYSIPYLKTSQGFLIPTLQKNHSLLLQRFFKDISTLHPTHNDNIFVNKTSPELWIGRGGPTN